MFLTFFLSLHDYNSTGSSLPRNTNIIQTATDVRPNILSEKNKTTFQTIVSRLASNFRYANGYYNNLYSTREILIKVADDSVFQLEAQFLSENDYCSYNLESKKIGFGNTSENAYSASCTDNISSVCGGSTVIDYMLQFRHEPKNIIDKRNPCPRIFHDQILSELTPYIEFEKKHLFRKVCNILLNEKKYFHTYLDNYYISDATEKKYNGEIISTLEFFHTIDMFKDDDPIIYEIREENPALFDEMGSLCFKIMQLSDETF